MGDHLAKHNGCLGRYGVRLLVAIRPNSSSTSLPQSRPGNARSALDWDSFSLSRASLVLATSLSPGYQRSLPCPDHEGLATYHVMSYKMEAVASMPSREIILDLLESLWASQAFSKDCQASVAAPHSVCDKWDKPVTYIPSVR